MPTKSAPGATDLELEPGSEHAQDSCIWLLYLESKNVQL